MYHIEEFHITFDKNKIKSRKYRSCVVQVYIRVDNDIEICTSVRFIGGRKLKRTELLEVPR
jgi:hypothetical protein